MRKWMPALLLAVALGASATGAAAQGRSARIGILGPAEEPRFSELSDGFTQGLRDQGPADGAFELVKGRVKRGDRAEARAVVERLARQKVDVLFVIGTVLTRLAREVSAEIPLVFITPGDPVASSLVLSLAHPGGNMTGVTFDYPELAAKRLALLKEMVPRVRRVLVLYDPQDASPMQGLAAARQAAPSLGITLVERQVRSRVELTRGLDALGEADGLLAIPGGMVSGHYEETISAANVRRRPTMFHARATSTRDALASYGANEADIARQAARLVTKVLKGARAGDLPVERPTRLELVVNITTAKVLGVTIPAHLLMEADRVIR